MNEILTAVDLQKRAPSVFARKPFFKMSEQYRFVPTIDVIDALQDNQFYPVYAAQSKTRIPGKGEFTKHVIRFRNIWNLRNTTDEIPEIVLVNSHDGSSAYKLMMGIFRLVCGNGLIIASSMVNEISVRHIGVKSLPQQVIDISHEIIKETPAVMTAIGDWKAIELSPVQQEAFASSALELRDSTIQLSPEQILRPRRSSDNKPNLWNTFNNVQENIIKGGNVGKNTSGRLRHTRGIKSVKEDIRLNRALWLLTEQMAILAKGGKQ